MTTNHDHASTQSLQHQIEQIIRPLAAARYGVEYPWASIEKMLATFEQDYGLDLNPDYQRGHVWTAEQQAHFIENVFRGVITRDGLAIKFNCAHWDDHEYQGDLPRGLSIVDGLQRLTAIRGFMAGAVAPFGRTIDGFAKTTYDPRRFTNRWIIRVEVLTLQSRRELLQHYLDLNAGGTPHAASELTRVRALRDAAAASSRSR